MFGACQRRRKGCRWRRKQRQSAAASLMVGFLRPFGPVGSAQVCSRGRQRRLCDPLIRSPSTASRRRTMAKAAGDIVCKDKVLARHGRSPAQKPLGSRCVPRQLGGRRRENRRPELLRRVQSAGEHRRLAGPCASLPPPVSTPVEQDGYHAALMDPAPAGALPRKVLLAVGAWPSRVIWLRVLQGHRLVEGWAAQSSRATGEQRHRRSSAARAPRAFLGFPIRGRPQIDCRRSVCRSADALVARDQLERRRRCVD
jgi:hypothetical protein